jgi:oligoribonuclease
MSAAKAKAPWLWVDLEMTGLDVETDQILEVAAVVTDSDFNVKEEYHRIVYQPQAVLDGMNDWCKKHHGASGLTAAVPHGTPLETVEAELLALMDRHYPRETRAILAGNSIGNDRRFIDKYLVKFEKRLHYRMIDVSSFKEVFREKWGVDFEKKKAHRAIGDIHESIGELKHYLGFVNVPPKA